MKTTTEERAALLARAKHEIDLHGASGGVYIKWLELPPDTIANLLADLAESEKERVMIGVAIGHRDRRIAELEAREKALRQALIEASDDLEGAGEALQVYPRLTKEALGLLVAGLPTEAAKYRALAGSPTPSAGDAEGM